MRVIQSYSIAVIAAVLFFLVLQGCAAEAPATGGPPDITSPELINIIPASGTELPSDNEVILLRFNESLDPLSVPAAITVYPDIDIDVKVRGSNIQIRPHGLWPQQTVLRFQCSRSIRDYQKNRIERPIQFLYSTGVPIPQGEIEGRIFNTNPQQILEAALFNYPITAGDSALFFTDVGEDGSYAFKNIPEGKYIVLAEEGRILNPEQDIQRRRYALQTSEWIQCVNEYEQQDLINLRLSDPLSRLTIDEVEVVNKDLAQITFSDKTVIPYLIPCHQSVTSGTDCQTVREFQVGDTLWISIPQTSDLEKYNTQSYPLIVYPVIDTIPPVIDNHEFYEQSYQILFSEPVIPVERWNQRMTLPVTGILDTSRIQLTAWFSNPFTFNIDSLPPDITHLEFSGLELADGAGNVLDSLMSIKLKKKPKAEMSESKGTGTVRGQLLPDPESSWIVEATNLLDGKRFQTRTDSAGFELRNLPAGKYSFWCYEQLDSIERFDYFSGFWNPFSRAAQFAYYPDTVEVRARWLVDGVQIVRPSLTPQKIESESSD